MTHKDTATLTIETNGIGFLIHASVTCLDSVSVGEESVIHTHLVVKEDSHTLYGFENANERTLFMQLISISGVGAKTAINLISLGSGAIANAVACGNSKALSAAKGVSQKMAEKIVIELRGKVTSSGLDIEPSGTAFDDALLGLMSLGMTKNAALSALKTFDTKGMTPEQIIKTALCKRGA